MSFSASSLRLSTDIAPRLDLSGGELLKLSIFRIYLSPNPTVVASVLNQRLAPTPRLTTEDILITCLHLHDVEHASWNRAK